MQLSNASMWLDPGDQVKVGGGINLWLGELSLFVRSDMSGVLKLDELIAAAQELREDLWNMVKPADEPTVQLRDETGADTDGDTDDDTDASYDAAVDAELEDRAEAL